jgi:hypothetical protein
MFVEHFSGTSFILDDTWLSNFDMQLFTDSIDHEKGHQQHNYWQTKYEKLSYGNVPSLIYKL